MTTPADPPRRLDFLAAFLSYLLPGLGQVLQGRVGKGVLFFVALYALFFYGMRMGQMKNVWLPDVSGSKMPEVQVLILGKLDGTLKSLYYRPQFLGQACVGLAAWPAILQYAGGDAPGDPAGPPPKPLPLLGRYMQAPPELELNALQRNGEKLRWDLGWVYTVIAGVLNILVVYDALAGPVIRDDDLPPAGPPAPPTGGAA